MLYILVQILDSYFLKKQGPTDYYIERGVTGWELIYQKHMNKSLVTMLTNGISVIFYKGNAGCTLNSQKKKGLCERQS